MRFVDIAVLVLCIQIGMGIVTVSGLFGASYYESSNMDMNIGDPKTLSEIEQTQVSFDILNFLRTALTWDWIHTYFSPIYPYSSGAEAIVTYVVYGLDILSGVLFSIAFLEFVRNIRNMFGSSG
jgi:hypothetical protein